MPLRLRISFLFICALLAAGFHLRADDWPQWLGPKRDSVWRESGILEKFPKDGPRIVWRTGIGPGYTGPAVASGRVFVSDRQQATVFTNSSELSQQDATNSSERVLCLAASDGSLLWKHEYPCRYTISYAAGPRATPTVDGGKVFTLGAEGNLFCLNVTNGQVTWACDFKSRFGIKAPQWGFTGHPLVDGDRLICLAGGDGSTVVAFDKNTGREVWRALSAAEPGYAAPMIYEIGGKRQLIVWQPEAAGSLDPETGKLNWSVPFKSRAGLTVAAPRQSGDYLFFTSFYNGALAVKWDTQTGRAVEAWRTTKDSERNTTHLNSIIGTPFLEGDYIYGVCSYGQLRCLELKTGSRVWETLQATTTGEPVRWANAFIVKNAGRFFLYNETGDLIIARLSPQGYEEVSRAHLLDPLNKDPGRKVVWSHPAFANRRIYARNDRELICADLSAGN
jgi:outer membrane protein assembly factor BamB